MLNPYQPPAFAPEPPPRPTFRRAPVATRIDRLFAATIDGALVLAILWLGRHVIDAFSPIDPGLLVFGSLGSGFVGMSVAFAVWLAINGYWLATRSQTVGKRLMGLQIVNVADERPASFVKIAFVRKLPMHVVRIVPVVGTIAWLVGVCFIFGNERRCIHDVIAGTKVVKLGTIRSLAL